MKSNLTLLIVLLVFSLQLNAQTSIGIKTHYGTAWQEYGTLPINGFDQRIDGYGIAAEISFQLNPLFQLKASPGYVRRGAACEPGFIILNPIEIRDALIFSNNIDLPLQLQFSWPMGNRFSIFTHAGGGISYMLNGYRTVSFWIEPDENINLDFQNEPTLNRFDFGLHGGLGVSYELGPGSIQLSGEYYHGLLDVTDTNTSQGRSLAIGLNYMVSIGKE